MRPRWALLALALVLVLGGCTAGDETQPVSSVSWPGCNTFKTQREAQRAWENSGRPARADGDDDQLVCESLPGTPAAAAPASTGDARAGSGASKTQGCRRPTRPVKIVYSRREYPNITRHIEDSIAKGYPRVLRINRIGTSERRDKLLAGIPTRPGMDRDEYPPAVGRRSPTHASVAYVPSAENRSAGSVLGSRLGRYCDRVRFTFTIRP
jgi:hypothetical protein